MSQEQRADVGDYLKIFAVFAVFLQSILGYELTLQPNFCIQAGIGLVYNLVKYSAPAFIFGILFTNTHEYLGLNFNAKHFYLNTIRAFLLPFLLWAAVYLVVFPKLQPVGNYHNLGQFCWQMINGNAAPHLWYATMMLQFLFLMPIFNYLVKWIELRPEQSGRKFISILIGIFLLTAVWLFFYDHWIYNGPEMRAWYLFDRFFVSFLLFGVLGTVSAIFFEKFTRLLLHWQWLIALIAGISLIVINLELFSYGFPLKLVNAPYYKPSMVIYDLSIIFLVALFAISKGQKNKKFSVRIHELARIAYLAYLPNVFWSWLLWQILAKNYFLKLPLLTTILIYVLTAVLSFITAKFEAKIFLK